MHLTCDHGYRVGETDEMESKIVCGDKGVWQVAVSGIPLVASSSCAPHCDFPCVNGGRCVSPNMCECPSSMFGDGCQYHACQDPPPHPPHGAFDGRYGRNAIYSMTPQKVITILKML